MSFAKKIEPYFDISAAITESVCLMLKQVSGIDPIISSYRELQDFNLKSDVSGIINLKSDIANDYLILSFDKKNILDFAELIFGQRYTKIDKTVSSCICELCNMTYGVFKTKMNQAGSKYHMSLPTTSEDFKKEVATNQIQSALTCTIELNQIRFNLILLFGK